MRLIDADALLREAHEEGAYGYVDAEQIANAPTIDPVKHGEWMVMPQRCDNQTFDECKCSVCGTVEYFNSGWKKFSFCPNCGAKMDKEKDDEAD